MRMMNKAQMWFMDFVIAMAIFSVVLISYYTYTTNISKQDSIIRDDLISDAKTIASSFTSSGYPLNWNSNDVIRIGFTDSNNKIDSTKFREFTEIGYNKSKRLLGITSDYFLFFTNESGDVQNVEGFCGTGGHGVNASYEIKAAYFYEKPGEEEFLKSFMEEVFGADVYCNQNCPGAGLGDFISNMNSYGFIVVEHPTLSTNDFNNFEAAAGPWVSEGNTLFLGGQIGPSQDESNGFGVQFKKISGQSENDRLSTVVNEDEFVDFNVGDNIIFRQAYYVRDTGPSNDLKDIARFNEGDEEFEDILDNKIAIARWPYGNGKVFFFSDFDANYLNGNFLEILQNAAKKWADAKCAPINISNLKRDNFVKVERVVAQNSSLLKMVMYLWN